MLKLLCTIRTLEKALMSTVSTLMETHCLNLEPASVTRGLGAKQWQRVQEVWLLVLQIKVEREVRYLQVQGHMKTLKTSELV